MKRSELRTCSKIGPECHKRYSSPRQNKLKKLSHNWYDTEDFSEGH